MPAEEEPSGSGGRAPARDVTRWLERWAAGEPGALDEIVPQVYDELRRVARRARRGERSELTLSTTALVHETYLKLSRQRILAARDRDEFFALAGNAMRHVLVDHARSRLRDKRGGGLERVPLDDQRLLLSTGQAEELLELDDALSRLTRANPRPAFVVEQRIFAGRSLSEIADWLGVSEKTVARDWTVAIAWLRKEVHASVDVLS
ncbi:MAG: sigma-70 family RNA polymerase sigma factor [Acidobacteria bacterium]|nr:sigma-70 family RNA polymerase sigma factor [Acidobacteriota bacterium]